MIKVDVKGCSSFVDAAKYESYVAKAFDAFDVLKNETGAGNDFLGWKKLPRQISERELEDYEAIRDKWMKKGVNLVIAIGIARTPPRWSSPATTSQRNTLQNLWTLPQSAAPPASSSPRAAPPLSPQLLSAW